MTPAQAMPPPLVLVHGLWDSPRLFRQLRLALHGRRDPLLIPHLPHGLGHLPLETMAAQLGQHIETAFGAEQPVDLLGFSMGGLIARTWLQLQGGHRRTRRFISVASPHRGTLTALPWPRWLVAGIDDMKPGSPLLQRLAADPAPLQRIDCLSLYCPTDLMVVPGWGAVLPVGPARPLPALLHSRVLATPACVRELVRELLRA